MVYPCRFFWVTRCFIFSYVTKHVFFSIICPIVYPKIVSPKVCWFVPAVLCLQDQPPFCWGHRHTASQAETTIRSDDQPQTRRSISYTGILYITSFYQMVKKTSNLCLGIGTEPSERSVASKKKVLLRKKL